MRFALLFLICLTWSCSQESSPSKDSETEESEELTVDDDRSDRTESLWDVGEFIPYPVYWFMPRTELIDENNPEDLVSLNRYLMREQYGDWPLHYGPTFTVNDSLGPKNGPAYILAYVVQAGSKDVMGFRTRKEAEAYLRKQEFKGEIVEKYYLSEPLDSAHQILFPRMYGDSAIIMFPRMHDSFDSARYEMWKAQEKGANQKD